MLSAIEFFDETFYLAQNPDVASALAAGTLTRAFEHFTHFGQFEQRQPTALFDPDYYLTLNADVAAAVAEGNGTAFGHYITFGQREGRNPSFFFDNNYYLGTNADVAAAAREGEITGIQHFALFGETEGRNPTRLYNEAYYLGQNPDVAAAVERDEISGIQHYVKFGAAEGREFTPFIEPNGSSLPNGVAAGDVTPNSAILWTRSTEVGPVVFEYATDANFSTIVGQQTAIATDPTVPLQVAIASLTPQTEYYYRATDASGTVAQGKFRTSTPPGTSAPLRFGVSGDWQGELSPYPSISNVAQRNLDFFVLMGDTLEADSQSSDLPGVRQAATLDEFRTKHNEIYSQRFGFNRWAQLRADTATYATWDDHEITNNFAGGAAPSESPQKNDIFGTEGAFTNDTAAFDAGLRGFLDYKPLQERVYGETGDARTAGEQDLYRYNLHGNEAATFILDVRSFRDAPLESISETASEAEVNQYLQDAFAPDRTMLGAAQLQQLKDDLQAAENSGVTWKFIMSTVPMQHFGIPVAGERWEGFAAERTELLRFIEQNDIDNVVFVTGDFHGNVVNNVTYQEGVGQPQIPTGAFDVMVGPVAIQLDIGSGPFAAPFGTATVTFTPDELLPESEKERYRAMTDVAEKNAFARQVIDNRIVPLGYDPVGLEGSEIDAQLLQGSYFAGHNYGWTEFEIDPQTQRLLVTTWGVEPYTEAELEANPQAIATRNPSIRMQFLVDPAQAGAPNLPDPVENAVTQAISQAFGLSPSDAAIVSVQRETWPNGCLGLAAAGELCTQALVPGWQVTVQNNGQVFVYRTDDSGSTVRLDEQASPL